MLCLIASKIIFLNLWVIYDPLKFLTIKRLICSPSMYARSLQVSIVII